MIHYIIIEIEADNINVAQTPVWSVSPYSVYNFLRAFQERINRTSDESNEFYINAYSVIQHSLQGNDGMLSGAGVESEYKKSFVTNKNVDEHAINHRFPYKLLASGHFSFVVEVEFVQSDILVETVFRRASSIILQNMKFLGGIITRSRLEGPLDSELKLKDFLKENNYSGLLYRLNDEKLQSFINDGNSPGEALLWSTQPLMDATGKEVVNKPGSNFPSLIGYQLLEYPKARLGTRANGHRHAYADPVFSVISRVPVRQYLKSKPEIVLVTQANEEKDDEFLEKMQDKINDTIRKQINEEEDN